jgi:hypothetical protein
MHYKKERSAVGAELARLGAEKARESALQAKANVNPASKDLWDSASKQLQAGQQAFHQGDFDGAAKSWVSATDPFTKAGEIAAARAAAVHGKAPSQPPKKPEGEEAAPARPADFKIEMGFGRALHFIWSIPKMPEEPITRADIEVLLNALPEVQKVSKTSLIPDHWTELSAEKLIRKLEWEGAAKEALAKHGLTVRTFVERLERVAFAVILVEGDVIEEMEKSVGSWEEWVDGDRDGRKEMASSLRNARALVGLAKAIPPGTCEAVKPLARKILQRLIGGDEKGPDRGAGLE